MRRPHVVPLVCGAMFFVACEGTPHHYVGFSSGPDASIGIPNGYGYDGGRSGPRDAAIADGGAGAGAAAVCGTCLANDVCCAEPSSIDYARCYDPMCVGCCQSGRDAGSCAEGGSCGSNQTCCAKQGSLEYGQCFPKSCTGCCQGGLASSDGGASGYLDAGVCGTCIGGLVCCSKQGAAQFGQCYVPSCTGCCQ